MKVIVLGAGPAGLMAAHAASITNNDVFIISKNRQSRMFGAQYLHAPIPMASGAPFTVTYDLDGTAEGYRDKLYRDDRVKVSPESLVGTHNAWDIRVAYDQLWDAYSPFIADATLGPKELVEILEDGEPDLLVNTVPKKVFCTTPEHTFAFETVWATEYYRGDAQDTNRVICSGDPDVPWYRTSTIDGWFNTEYPEDKKPPLGEDKVHKVIKPVLTTCDCIEREAYKADASFLSAGRYGTWTKGVLSHRAFYDTFNLLDGRTTMETNQ